ncbi:MAG TPA: hypothetical protein VE338_17470, partial [Ktedonobacterales bacterium]|nr:hypothetical protein [Ktedonobacterales bacterium]
MRAKPPFWTGAERIQWGCALMSLLGEHDLTNLHLVISGYRSIERSLQVAPFAQAARTARALLGDLGTRGAVQNAVYIYNAAQAPRTTSRRGSAAASAAMAHDQPAQPLEIPEDIEGLADTADLPAREQYELQELLDDPRSPDGPDAPGAATGRGASAASGQAGATSNAGNAGDTRTTGQRGSARSYRIDPTTLAFTPLFPDLDPTISQAQAILRTGLPRRATLIPLADTTHDLVAVLQREREIPIRLGGLTFPPPRQHDLAARERPRATIHVTRAELLALARELDAEDRAAGRSSLAWETRLA